MNDQILKHLLQSETLRGLEQFFQANESVLIEGLWNAPKALVTSLLQQATGKHVVVLTGSSQEELQLFQDFSLFSDAVITDYPAWETLPSDEIAPSPDIVGERYRVLRELSTSPKPLIIITGLQACLQRVILPDQFRRLYLSLSVGDKYPFQKLIDQLVAMGYRRETVASDKGEFAVRGGILDIFPVASPDPYRIEFWGDDIETMRIYDPVGQKSVLSAKHVEIPPALELELLNKSERTGTLLDYLGADTCVVFDDLLALEDRYASLVKMGGVASKSFNSLEGLLTQIGTMQSLYLTSQSIESLSEVRLLDKLDQGFYSEKSQHRISFQMFQRELQARRWRHPFVSVRDFLLPQIPHEEEVEGQELLEALSHHPDVSLHFLCSELEEQTLQTKIDQAKISLPKSTSYDPGYLSSGLALPETSILLFPYTEISHRYSIRRQKQRSTYHTTPSQIQDLSAGELVVHFNHGIGKYLGIEQRPDVNGALTEFFQIEYADNAKLYVPLNQAYLISKYIGSSEEMPKLHTIGSNRWKKSREQTEQAILVYAKDLLELYAKRSVQAGFSYPSDSPEMQNFEEDFPYVETEDQLAAIASIKQDMLAPRTMDRLICGDVGYGKTEVAMRAAFKAAWDGQKQVAVLVPTTVLAMQHFENFAERMKHFPVKVGVLSRFQTAKETRETLAGVASGEINIVIGTHRIISDDVKFKDLGLVIIDEEQRFGVKAKEHLKEIKLNVDCLTLSATPIPRTLYMSLVGVRDMSIINTPPQDRLPITTIISEPTDLVLKNALLRELARDGQAFVIHNRVESIYDTADRIKQLLPQARVVVGHGQMHADEIDQVFHAFKSGRADILISTTIVENGIDIPNANTILIERADHFGLADLYQLRGRVGRWNRRAYAYFLVKNMHRMPELSRKRLNALAEASGYGGGMKLAMRDLEIRGAGNILGIEQSGHVSSIGFHLYCKLLKRAVKALQGEMIASVYDTKVEFPFDARLPELYLHEVSLRMEFYQRLGEALSPQEVEEIWEELKDRFGPPPEQVDWLCRLTRLRIFGALHHFTLIKVEKAGLTAERKHGKQTTVKKLLLPKYTSPQDLEEKVIAQLKQGFNLREETKS